MNQDICIRAEEVLVIGWDPYLPSTPQPVARQNNVYNLGSLPRVP